MINFKNITGFDWDAGNERKSKEKHNVTKGEAEQVFFNQPLLIIEDSKHSHTELRLHALGTTNTNRRLHLTFTLRNEQTLIRVISARDMHRKEKVIYGKA